MAAVTRLSKPDPSPRARQPRPRTVPSRSPGCTRARRRPADGAEGGKIPSKLDGVVPSICAELFRRKQDVEKRGDYKLRLEATLVEVKGRCRSR